MIDIRHLYRPQISIRCCGCSPTTRSGGEQHCSDDRVGGHNAKIIFVLPARSRPAMVAQNGQTMMVPGKSLAPCTICALPYWLDCRTQKALPEPRFSRSAPAREMEHSRRGIGNRPARQRRRMAYCWYPAGDQQLTVGHLPSRFQRMDDRRQLVAGVDRSSCWRHRRRCRNDRRTAIAWGNAANTDKAGQLPPDGDWRRRRRQNFLDGRGSSGRKRHRRRPPDVLEDWGRFCVASPTPRSQLEPDAAVGQTERDIPIHIVAMVVVLLSSHRMAARGLADGHRSMTAEPGAIAAGYRSSWSSG